MNAEPGGAMCQDCNGPECAVCEMYLYFVHHLNINLYLIFPLAYNRLKVCLPKSHCEVKLCKTCLMVT